LFGGPQGGLGAIQDFLDQGNFRGFRHFFWFIFYFCSLNYSKKTASKQLEKPKVSILPSPFSGVFMGLFQIFIQKMPSGGSDIGENAESEDKSSGQIEVQAQFIAQNGDGHRKDDVEGQAGDEDDAVKLVIGGFGPDGAEKGVQYTHDDHGRVLGQLDGNGKIEGQANDDADDDAEESPGHSADLINNLPVSGV